uniref:Uncharacterized protein n=1 Tax=Rhizophora mucronata TaxID=61149 RepID=A0A2P2QBX4_RHIMU
MSLDLNRPLYASNSLLGILHQKLADEVLNFYYFFMLFATTHTNPWNCQGLPKDVEQGLLVGFTFERCPSVQHFVQKHP